jgi:hypothetical protein
MARSARARIASAGSTYRYRLTLSANNNPPVLPVFMTVFRSRASR